MKSTAVDQSLHCTEIRVRGIVQGVGFRPTVYRLATEGGLAGEVLNDTQGVRIRVKGNDQQIADFLRELATQAPPLARIDSMEQHPYRQTLRDGFRIVASEDGQNRTAITPDAATCQMCLAEISDSGDRRYRYPFTNCTHCGPRLSIVMSVPYDRPNTSMHAFPMCRECLAEYDNPLDRRFHAQPNACPDCGPSLTLLSTNVAATPEVIHHSDCIMHAVEYLRQGKIIAIKGLGGFHLACDATNGKAVACLRARKHRYDKPFALMARDLRTIGQYCTINSAEQALLTSSAAPMVLLQANGLKPLPDTIAPNQSTYGFMLPYTPLHALLMEQFGAPVVLTSGNISDEPQCIDNTQAGNKLGDIADALLLHDRDIVNRLDDSVTRVIAGEPSLLRRARGYAPAPLQLPAGFERARPVLAFGGELKNTFCLLRNGEAILSQHIGDLENVAAYNTYRDTMALYLELYDHKPNVLAVDLHPEYLSTKLGRSWQAGNNHRLIEVQHHHAHIAACLADNNIPLDAPPVLGIALDGMGFGLDETLWGGEFLQATYHGFERLAHFKPVPMPGGTQAILEPWRMAFAYLRQDIDWESVSQQYKVLEFFRHAQEKELQTLSAMMDKKINSPITSSCGRLFDAVAAIIGLREKVNYEGQAAIELENALDSAGPEPDNADYRLTIVQSRHDKPALIQTASLWQPLLRDVASGCSNATISARFHRALIAAIIEMIEHLTEQHNNPWQNRIALSGGVFQNAFLTETLMQRLETNGYQVLTHHHVPPNDGGLALGQAAIAAAVSMPA